MRRKTKIFLVLCAALLATDVGLVALNAVSARNALMGALRDRADTLREGFNIALYSTETKLMEIASFIGELDDVKAQLAAAVTARETEPGAINPPGVEHARWALADIVEPRWTQLRFRYMLRQLSFYLTPDLTALYRADIPYIYGDQAMKPDSLVARAAKSRRPASGFDIDRRTVGIRAAVPIKGDRTLGVVEVGTSFDTMLIPICPSSRCGAAVLLDSATVAKRMAPDAEAAYFTDDRRVADQLIEASTNPSITRSLIESGRVSEEADLMSVGERWLAVVRFPLFDHLGKEEPERGAVGSVYAWVDVDEAVHTFERAQLTNIGFAVLAFLLIAGLIRLLIDAVTTRLEREITSRTNEVETLLAKVSHMASRDVLTDLLNRRAFAERLRQEIARAEKGGERFSLISVDLDHFKAINDRYGHPAGDEVLRAFAAALRDTLRGQDVAGRLGGEEFALLLPATGVDGAAALAARLRARVADSPVALGEGGALSYTFSGGIVTWCPGLGEEDILRHVDNALYEAKHDGRDRIVTGTIETTA